VTWSFSPVVLSTMSSLAITSIPSMRMASTASNSSVKVSETNSAEVMAVKAKMAVRTVVHFSTK